MAAQPSSGPPHQPREVAFSSLGVATSMVCCEYEDRTAVFVSQDGRLGTLLLVTRHESRGGAAVGPPEPGQQSSAPWGEGGPESGAGEGGAGSGPGDGGVPGAGESTRPGSGVDGGATGSGTGGGWEEEEDEGEGAARGPGTVFSMSVLLGKRDEPLLVACARSIAEGLSNTGATKPLFLSLGLSPEHHSMEALKDISKQVVKHWPA